MPALFGESHRPESVSGFFERTRDPEALHETISRRRENMEYRGFTPPSPDILLAQHIVALGVQNIVELNNQRGKVFPGGYGHPASSAYDNKLSPEEQTLAKYSYATIIFGVMVQSMHDTFTDPINQTDRVIFNRQHFIDNLNYALAPTGCPEVEMKDLPTTLPPDPETGSEILHKNQSNALRDYINKHGTYDFITANLEFQIPDSLRRFMMSLPFARHLIFQPGQGNDTKNPSIRDAYHARAIELLEHQRHMDRARRLLAEAVDAPPDRDETETPLPDFMKRNDWDF